MTNHPGFLWTVTVSALKVLIIGNPSNLGKMWQQSPVLIALVTQELSNQVRKDSMSSAFCNTSDSEKSSISSLLNHMVLVGKTKLTRDTSNLIIITEAFNLCISFARFRYEKMLWNWEIRYTNPFIYLFNVFSCKLFLHSAFLFVSYRWCFLSINYTPITHISFHPLPIIRVVQKMLISIAYVHFISTSL